MKIKAKTYYVVEKIGSWWSIRKTNDYYNSSLPVDCVKYKTSFDALVAANSMGLWIRAVGDCYQIRAELKTAEVYR